MGAFVHSGADSGTLMLPPGTGANGTGNRERPTLCHAGRRTS